MFEADIFEQPAASAISEIFAAAILGRPPEQPPGVSAMIYRREGVTA
jgi:hypothetical protein